MWIKPELRLVATLFAVFVCSAIISAQGGWRQWDIHLRDGTTISANPLGINKKGMFTRSMSSTESGIERSRIAYLAAGRRELPGLPSEKFKEDVIVMLDGGKVVGAIKFREIKFSEGKYVQNGREQTLENVAYIIFKQTKKK